ncbi:MAG: hypothetical protein Q8L71_10915 [Thiobacillus sp.]|nr:hypothetical protein [Thiobacillus sp.]
MVRDSAAFSKSECRQAWQGVKEKTVSIAIQKHCLKLKPYAKEAQPVYRLLANIQLHINPCRAHPWRSACRTGFCGATGTAFVFTGGGPWLIGPGKRIRKRRSARNPPDFIIVSTPI